MEIVSSGSKSGSCCSVSSCLNYSNQKNRKPLFRFPRDNELCRKWVAFCGRKDLVEAFEEFGSARLNKSHRICAAHFQEKCFRNPLLLSQGLHSGSFPDLHLNEPPTGKPRPACPGLQPKPGPERAKSHKAAGRTDSVRNKSLIALGAAPLLMSPAKSPVRHRIAGTDAAGECRLCLVRSRDLVPLSKKGESFVTKIADVIQIRIADEHDLPTEICQQCVAQLNAAFNFKQCCHIANNLLTTRGTQNWSVPGELSVGSADVEAMPDSDQSYDWTTLKVVVECGIDGPSEPPASKPRTSDVPSMETTDTVSPFKCSFCAAPFGQINMLTRHLQSLEMSASECQRLAARQRTDADAKGYECANCARRFGKANLLAVHVKRMHEAERSHTCDGCAATFRSKSQLSRHGAACPSRKVHRCPECRASFSKTTQLQAHVREHGVEKPFRCAHCAKEFAMYARLASHLQTHSQDKRHQCAACGKRFVQKTHLVGHLRTHTGEKPFACADCTKAFVSKSDLAKHVRFHTGERPYACAVCPRRFTQSNTLTSHMRVHPGAKPFACPACGKGFFCRSDIKKHRAQKRECKERA